MLLLSCPSGDLLSSAVQLEAAGPSLCGPFPCNLALYLAPRTLAHPHSIPTATCTTPCHVCCAPFPILFSPQVRTNMANTITSIKRLIGTRFNDPAVQTELAGNNFKGVAMADGETGMQVSRVSYLSLPSTTYTHCSQCLGEGEGYLPHHCHCCVLIHAQTHTFTRHPPPTPPPPSPFRWSTVVRRACFPPRRFWPCSSPSCARSWT